MCSWKLGCENWFQPCQIVAVGESFVAIHGREVLAAFSIWKRGGRRVEMASAQPGCFSMPSSRSSRFSRKASRQSDRFVEDVVQELAEGADEPSSFTLGVSEDAKPEHLVILVNGIAGSAENWRFAAEKFKDKLADKVVVHCSAVNTALRTLNGVDIMGNRLAKEVMDVVRDTPGVTKVSFLSHSLGGLISRYAIGQLYAPPGGRSLLQERLQERSEASTSDSEVGGSGREHNSAPFITHPQGSGAGAEAEAEAGTIAGLKPINFITLATPHLGSRGNQHLPFLFGLAALERVAPLVSHWFVGRTGKHLFLADGDKNNPPLLQRMVTDCDEGRFLSALRSFKQRTAYANICHDHMVGWRTASIRKASEMPQPLHDGLDPKYPHVVREEKVPQAVKDSSKKEGSEPKEALAFDAIEEEIVAGLQQVSWWRVDVSFMKVKAKYQAHNLIQVKSASAHSEGTDVIHHILDNHF